MMWNSVVEAWNREITLWDLLIFAVAFTAIGLVGTVVSDTSTKSWRERLAGGGVALVVAGLLFTGLWLLRPWLERPPHLWSHYQDNVVGYGVILAVALYLLRRRRQEIYGFLEIVVALSALYVFSTLPAELFSAFSGAALLAWIAGFAAPVYVMIGGIDNIETGWRKRRVKQG